MIRQAIDAIYIHIPFCERKCNYCDFLSFASTKEMRKKYVNYLLKEIDMYPKYEYSTVYFGGGTPSLLEVEDIERILDRLEILPNAEVTMEVNPKTVSYEYLKSIHEAGINRLSIGIQSFNDKYLGILGRIHSSEEAIITYKDARRAGFDNISLDLMFSLPDQSIDEVKEDLNKLLTLKPEHFSIYSLIWEEGTPFFKQLERGVFKETDNDIEAQMYEDIIDTSTENGYVHYEISNFSLPGYEARHNSKYWENREYLGVGLGASGYINNIRYKNQVQFLTYYDNIDKGVFPIIEKEELTEDEKQTYMYILGLRLLKTGIIPVGDTLEKCKELEREGFLVEQENRYILSRKGIMLANDVLSEFL